MGKEQGSVFRNETQLDRLPLTGHQDISLADPIPHLLFTVGNIIAGYALLTDFPIPHIRKAQHPNSRLTAGKPRHIDSPINLGHFSQLHRLPDLSITTLLHGIVNPPLAAVVSPLGGQVTLGR